MKLRVIRSSSSAPPAANNAVRIRKPLIFAMLASGSNWRMLDRNRRAHTIPSISHAMFAPIPEGAPRPLEVRNSPIDVLLFILYTTAKMIRKAMQNQIKMPVMEPSRDKLCLSRCGNGPKLGPTSTNNRSVTIVIPRQTILVSFFVVFIFYLSLW